MIGLIEGTVVAHRSGRIVVQTSGIGYLVAVCSLFDFPQGGQVSLHTHLAVRENALDLYGFKDTEGLAMFEALITIPKIGPKTALQILVQADVYTLKKAILTQDPVYLTKISGLGKKTAEKIVLELKDHFDTAEYAEQTGEEDTDAMDALLALGYGHRDVRDALAKIPATTSDTRKRITEALRILTS